ncbi:MAG: DMT family transporter [Synechocystis sp.]|nr:DMT family transporter [Synechocystis sp.]
MSPFPRFDPLTRLPNSVYLAIATVIFAASNAITRKIIEIGEANLINGHNPISPCNVLFVGNLCAFALLLPLCYRQCRPAVLQTLTRKDWGLLILVAVLSGALAPALVFTALGLTSVANVVLLSRLAPPLELLFSFLILGAVLNPWTIAGSLLSLLGVALTLLLDPTMPLHNPPQMLMVGRGEILTLVAAFVTALANVSSKAGLQSIPTGLFSLFRNLVGALIFFWLAIALFGPDHFHEATAPFLWGWMVIYALVIVVIGQFAWFVGIKKAPLSTIAVANAGSPLIAILIAFLLLGEVPTQAQYIGGMVIFIGILVGLKGSTQGTQSLPKQPLSPGKLLSLVPGFKGL